VAKFRPILERHRNKYGEHFPVDERFEVFTAVEIHLEVFWLRRRVGYYPEDGASNVLRNNGDLPQHLMASQARRPPREFSSRYGK
jgi:hypothetical protein